MRNAKRRSAGITRALVCLLALMLLATSCSSDVAVTPEATPGGGDGSGTDGGGTDGNGGGGGSGGVVTTVSQAGTEQLGLRLSPGVGENSEVAPELIPIDGTELTAEQMQQIFDRLPEWTEPEDDREDFNRPAETLAPPLVGDTVENEFPVDGGDLPPEVVDGPLEVLRFQPEGDVPLAPFVSVTFNQAMVPLGTLGQVDALDVPVTITPEVPGHWEWIGTRTLRFESDSELFDRMPMATNYRVVVPAGTASQSGGELAAEVSWEFSTATPQVLSLSPEQEGLPLDQIFVVTFDQIVDPAQVLEVSSLSADGQNVAIRLATTDELLAQQDANQRFAQAPEGRAVAFRAVDLLPKDASLSVQVGPGVASAEGPVVGDASQQISAETYGPLSAAASCNYDRRDCRPFDPIVVSFNNQLDLTDYSESMVSVSPEIPGLTVSANGREILLRGATAGQTTYTITVSGNFTDVFGQTLGEDKTFSVRVGSMEPFLGGFENRFITLDPLADNPAINLATVNHETVRLLVYRVTVDDRGAFEDFRRSLGDEDERPAPGQLLDDTTVEIGAAEDTIGFTALRLGEYLDDGLGHLIVLVEPTGALANLSRDDDLYWQNRPQTTWVQSTNIGLDAFSDGQQMVVWATDLRSGDPMADVSVDGLGATNGDGLLTVTAAGEYDTLIATKGNDVALLDGRWRNSSFVDVVRWYVIDDRGIYRPGETVSMKGWVRRLALASDGQLTQLGDQRSVAWTVNDARGNEIGTGTANVSALGGFDLEFELPAGANLGTSSVSLTLDGLDRDVSGVNTSHRFQVQEFRRPEFEVTARNESVGPYVNTSPVTVAVEANYFSGGALPNASVDWNVTTTTASYDPPNWNDFAFGVWVPWWYSYGGGGDVTGDYVGDFGCCEDAGVVEVFSGLTDASGTHYLRMDFEGAENQDRPSTVTANAAVMDVNRQVWAASTSLLVHSGELYVGLRSERTFVRKGEDLDISAVVTDIDGNPVADRNLDVAAQRLAWKTVDGNWEEVVVEEQICSVTTTGEPVSCTFATELGGKYRIAAVVTDDNGGKNRTELTRWVSGGQTRPITRVELESAELVPDKEEYQPGDTAEILVQSPFGSAQGLLTLVRNGIESTESFVVDGDTTVLSIPITDDHFPNLSVRVDLVGTATRVNNLGEPMPDAPDRPAYATGTLTLRIPPLQRTLNVTAVPDQDALAPGSETAVTVTVTDASGNPVDGAEVSLVVVDEAVLALSGYNLLDPVDVFYREFGNNVSATQGRRWVRLTDPDLLLPDQGDFAGGGDEAVATADAEFAMEESADGASPATSRAVEQKSGDTAIEVRNNFDAQAVFAPAEITGADGTAVVNFTLPDSLTRYRIMAVAVDGADEFGSGESNVTARLPLMVRPSAPRFLNFGDQFELPVIVQNQTDEDMEVQVVMQTANLSLTGVQGQLVTVPANDRIEVRFPAAAEDVGTASFRVAAVSGDMADASTLALPVYTPATSEAFATYGVVDDGAVFQPILGPEGVFTQFGGLEINTSSTALQALTDAVLYVNEYQYASSDAAASRILSIASLRDVLEAFEADGMPTPTEMDASVNEAITTIEGLQNGDGGFPYWQRWRTSQPYNSVHVAHALVVARDAGYSVDPDVLQNALWYLQDIESYYPSWYSQEARHTISSYAVHVRWLAGEADPAKAQALYAEGGDDISLDAMAWLWPVLGDSSLDAEIEQRFNNRVTETAAGATFVNNYSDDDYVLLHSNRRTDGIVLNALIRQTPDSDLVPKVVQGLLAGKTKGRWNNISENTFILLALNDYFDEFESVTPDFVARVWLGDTYAAEHEYVGRSTDRNETLVPMSVLVDEGDTDIILSKEGEGRLYYRLGLNYAPDDLDLDPMDRGFVVQRTYEAVDDPDDVWMDDDGVWHIKAGAEVRVRLTMTADSRRTHVALVDPLPAGLEILNPALAVTEDIARDTGEQTRSYYWWWQWFEHQNMRDDRAEAFTSWLSAGTYDYSYVARATTPGTFVTPPTKAEEMYHPETFGRSATDTVVVEG